MAPRLHKPAVRNMFSAFRTFVIAEIGQNHQGDMEIAKKLIKAAKECGADCAKFQKTCIEEKFNNAALEQKYDNEHSWGKTYGEHKRHLEFSDKQFRELKAYAEEIGIMFTASAMDSVSLQYLVDLEVPFIKIGSGDSNNLPLIEQAAITHIPLVISTGMVENLDVLRKIYRTVLKFHKYFAFLHCVSAYPTPIQSVNLNNIQLYKREFPDIKIGYSGHELGIHITQAAVGAGAKLIERHITLDKTQKGSDHKCSLEPHEFALLVQNIREIDAALGNPVKKLAVCELPCFQKLRKTIVSSADLAKGTKLSKGHIKIKVAVPKGIDAWLFDKVIGQTLLKDVKADEPITSDCIGNNLL